MTRKEAETLLRHLQLRYTYVVAKKKKCRALEARALTKMLAQDIIPPEKLESSLTYSYYRGCGEEEFFLKSEISYLKSLLTKD